MKNLFLAASILCAGCATSSHIFTGKVHPALSAEAVKFFTAQPDNSEIIGLVNASNIWIYKQRGMDSVMARIRYEAGLIGANGVVLNIQDNNAWTGSKVCGTAVFVP
jgi:hypothetical protein